MISAHIVYFLGIIINIINILLWQIIIRSQIRELRNNYTNIYLKKVLLLFSIVMLASNLNPLWYDIYKLLNTSPVTNIVMAYILGNYISRTIAVIMFYLIYRTRIE